jgi:hypothetical protein
MLVSNIVIEIKIFLIDQILDHFAHNPVGYTDFWRLAGPSSSGKKKKHLASGTP